VVLCVGVSPGGPLTMIPFAQYAIARALPNKLSKMLLFFSNVWLSYDHHMVRILPFSNILLYYSKPSLKLSNYLLSWFLYSGARDEPHQPEGRGY
jgi:hypothetical protein